MRLGRISQWFNRKAMSRQMKTLTSLGVGDFIWQITTIGGKLKTFVYKIDHVDKNKETGIYYYVRPTEFNDGLDIMITAKNIEKLNTSFVCDGKSGDTLISNQLVFEKYLALKKIEMQHTPQTDLDNIEKAIENANKLLCKKLNTITGKTVV